MTELRTQICEALREADDERLPVDDVAAMRQLVLASVRTGPEDRRAPSWLQPLAVAATVVGMIAAGIAAGQRFEPRPGTGGTAAGADDDPADAAPAGGRQLHFSTPGGTRIIWIFNSDLDLTTTP